MKAPEDLVSRFLDVDTDARSLIVRVLTSLTRLSPKGISSDAIIEFLEASFGAFQAARARGGWKWDREDLSLRCAAWKPTDWLQASTGYSCSPTLGAHAAVAEVSDRAQDHERVGIHVYVDAPLLSLFRQPAGVAQPVVGQAR
jgi:hypothetical protein